MPNKPVKARESRRGRPPGSTRDLRGSAKQLCLQAVARLFLEKPAYYADPVAGLTVAAVAREAGVHRNTVNRHLPADEWGDAIATYLLDRTDLFREEFEEISRTVQSTEGLPTFDAVAQTAATDLKTLSDNPAWNAMEVLATCVAPKSPRVASAAQRCYGELDEATWQEIYGIVMARAKREPRPPFTGSTIGAVLQALVEGAGIRHLFENGIFLDREGLVNSDCYGAYPLSVAALLSVLTKPVGGTDDRSVDEVVRELIGP